MIAQIVVRIFVMQHILFFYSLLHYSNRLQQIVEKLKGIKLKLKFALNDC